MTVKLTFFYNQYKQGFSETYYLNVTNPATAVTGLTDKFLTAMTQFRSLATLLYAVRGQQIESPFRSFTRLVRGAFQGAVQTDPDAQPDVIATTAVLQLVSQEATKRRLFLRGLPDDYVKRDAFGNDLFVGTFKTQVQTMVKEMIAAQFAVRKQTRPPIGGLAYARVELLSPDPANAAFTRLLLPVTAGFTPVVGEKISFRGIPAERLPNFPRINTVISQAVVAGALTVSIRYALPGALSVNPVRMTASNIIYAYEPISEFTFERFSQHKTGSPFGRLAGRKRAVRSVSR